MYFIRGEDKSKDGDDNRALLTMDKFTDPHRLRGVRVRSFIATQLWDAIYGRSRDLRKMKERERKTGEKEGKKDREMRRKERLETSPFGPRENTTMMWKQRWMRYIFEFRRSLNIDSCDSNRTIPRSEMNRFALDLRSSRAHARKY